MVAVVSNGTAVLGLGDIGPRPPAGHGRQGGAVQGVRAGWMPSPSASERPQCRRSDRSLQGHCAYLRRQSIWRYIRAPSALRSSRRWKKELDIPVFHDDQHGTAIVAPLPSSTPCAWWARRWKMLHIVLNGPAPPVRPSSTMLYDRRCKGHHRRGSVRHPVQGLQQRRGPQELAG